MTDADGPPDPQLDPARSPGVGRDVEGLEDVEVSREDVTIGEADPSELTAGDTDPVADDEVGSLVATLREGSATERRRAAIALGDRERTDGVVSALATAARTDEDADVRQFAVEALGELGGERAQTVAVASLADEDPWVRAEAVVALDNCDRQRHAGRFEGRLNDDHHAVRRNALLALWKLRGPNVFDTAVDFVEDESERVREWVAAVLGDVEDDRAEPHLRRLANDDSDIVARTARAALDGETPKGATADPSGRAERFDTPPDL